MDSGIFLSKPSLPKPKVGNYLGDLMNAEQKHIFQNLFVIAQRIIVLEQIQDSRNVRQKDLL